MVIPMKPHFLYDKFIFIKFLIFYYKKLNRVKSLETQIFSHTLLWSKPDIDLYCKVLAVLLLCAGALACINQLMSV